jgi:hypothetical protein
MWETFATRSDCRGNRGLFNGDASAVDGLMFALSAEVKKVLGLAARNLELQGEAPNPKL